MTTSPQGTTPAIRYPHFDRTIATLDACAGLLTDLPLARDPAAVLEVVMKSLEAATEAVRCELITLTLGGDRHD